MSATTEVLHRPRRCPTHNILLRYLAVQGAKPAGWCQECLDEALGRKLAQRRKAVGLSKTELARLAGVTPGSIAGLEAGAHFSDEFHEQVLGAVIDVEHAQRRQQARSA